MYGKMHSHDTVEQAFSQKGVRVSFGHPIADFGHPNIHIFLCIMQWDEKELDTQFAPNVYFWTPNSEILANALLLSITDYVFHDSKVFNL